MTSRSLDIVIVDSDEIYLKKLAGAMSTGRKNNCIVRAFSEKRKALDLLKISQPDALVIGQQSYCDEFKDSFTGKTIILTEDEGSGEHEMSRYRSASSIMCAIGDPVRKRSDHHDQRDVFITGVMSFCEAEYKNAYALTLAEKEAAYKKVLYINLDEFSQLRGRLKTTGGYTISDAIYAYRQGSVDSEFIRKAIGRLGRFDFLAPTACADDLAGLKAREINRFICDIAAHYGYSRVILDVGYALGEPWEVFKFCDAADIPYKEGLDGRLSEFDSYMHRSGKTFIMDMIRQIKIPQQLLPYNDASWFDGEDKKWLKWLESDRSIL